jgi:hypothetical protein
MFIIKCDTLTEVWSNDLDHDFISNGVVKYFSHKLGRVVDPSELEVYYMDSPDDRLKAMAHIKGWHHAGFKLNAASRKCVLNEKTKDGKNKKVGEITLKKVLSWDKKEVERDVPVKRDVFDESGKKIGKETVMEKRKVMEFLGNELES